MDVKVPHDVSSNPRSLPDGVFPNRLRDLRIVLSEEQLDAAVVYGNSFAAGALRYLTGFAPRRDAYLSLPADSGEVLFIQFFNHVPDARYQLAVPVEWGGASSVASVAQHLRDAVGTPRRIGLIGPLPYQEHRQLAGELNGAELVDLSGEFWRSRLVKGPEEIELTRRGAGLTDEALGALVTAMSAGVTERELGAEVASYCTLRGGHIGICFLLATSMEGEGRYVPAQRWTDRALAPGHMVAVELSAGYAGHTGQVLRTITLGEPPELVARLHRVAEHAFAEISRQVVPGARAAELLEAARVIDDAGFTICDDVVHGYGGGYLEPVLRTPATQHAPFRDFELEPGMMLVIQPNVVAADHSIGVQTGELVLVTEEGHESLHGYPQGMISV